MRVAKVEQGEFEVFNKALGSVTPLNTVNLRSRVAGELVEVGGDRLLELSGAGVLELLVEGVDADQVGRRLPDHDERHGRRPAAAADQLPCGPVGVVLHVVAVRPRRSGERVRMGVRGRLEVDQPSAEQVEPRPEPQAGRDLAERGHLGRPVRIGHELGGSRVGEDRVRHVVHGPVVVGVQRC